MLIYLVVGKGVTTQQTLGVVHGMVWSDELVLNKSFNFLRS